MPFKPYTLQMQSEQEHMALMGMLDAVLKAAGLQALDTVGHFRIKIDAAQQSARDAELNSKEPSESL